MNKFKKFKDLLNLNESSIVTVQLLNIQNKVSNIKECDIKNNTLLSSKIDMLEEIVDDIYEIMQENNSNYTLINSITEAYRKKSGVDIRLNDGTQKHLDFSTISNITYIYDELSEKNRSIFLDLLIKDEPNHSKICSFCEEMLKEGN